MKTEIVWEVPKQFAHLLGDRPRPTNFDQPIGKARALLKAVNLRAAYPYVKILWEAWEIGPYSQYGPQAHSRLCLRMIATLDPDGTCKMKWTNWYKNTGLFHGRGLHFTGRGFVTFDEMNDLQEIVSQAEDFLKEVQSKKAA